MEKVWIHDCLTNYSKSGDGEHVVLLLHGWGQNTIMMQPIEEHLSGYLTVYNLDLPGFGESKEPPVSFSVYDYADWLSEFIDHFDIKNPIIIAHSFGGRLALIYAASHPVYKLVLTGGAGIKDKHGLDYYLKVYSYKAAKKGLDILGLKKTKEKLMANAGSSDYQKTSGVMRESFVKIVNEDLSYLLKDIFCETLLVWGEKDEMTPLWMGQKMEKEMPNAGLAVFEDDDHFAYWHQMNRFLAVLDIFLKEDR